MTQYSHLHNYMKSMENLRRELKHFQLWQGILTITARLIPSSLLLSFPPSSPSQTGPNDLRHFDPEFTDEPVPSSIGCSPDSALVTASIKEAAEAFVGFSYAPSMDSYL